MINKTIEIKVSTGEIYDILEFKDFIRFCTSAATPIRVYWNSNKYGKSLTIKVEGTAFRFIRIDGRMTLAEVVGFSKGGLKSLTFEEATISDTIHDFKIKWLDDIVCINYDDGELKLKLIEEDQ